VGEPADAWHSRTVNDYDRIARIIRHLDRHHVDQPELGELAAVAGLSPFHLHRLFSTWAGVTPKAFLQCLTLTHAREALRRGESVLDAAMEAGLSGPGRLHDLCVTLEAATPGEIKSGGTGMVLRHGVADTPFGPWFAARTGRGVSHVSFGRPFSEARQALREDWPRAQLVRDDAAARELAKEVFSPMDRTPATRTLRAFVRGSSFQVTVWRALLRIPAGTLVSYGQLAQAVGHPGASRATGTAVGHNPIAYIIPCHRVIRETGVIGNYRWDPTRKRALLAFEGAAREGLATENGA